MILVLILKKATHFWVAFFDEYSLKNNISIFLNIKIIQYQLRFIFNNSY